MRYGRGKASKRWHQITPDGKARCFKGLDIVEVKDSADVHPELRCENCDAHLREQGQELAKVAKKKRRHDPKTVYVPRNRFED